jgi:hypothetical protein
VLRRGLAVHELRDARGPQLDAPIALAELLRDHGRAVEVRAVLESVLAGFTEGADTVAVRRAQELLGLGESWDRRSRRVLGPWSWALMPGRPEPGQEGGPIAACDRSRIRSDRDVRDLADVR